MAPDGAVAATNTLVQTLVDDDKLGRVMSLYAVAFFAGAPIGALLQGDARQLARAGPRVRHRAAPVCLVCRARGAPFAVGRRRG